VKKKFNIALIPTILLLIISASMLIDYKLTKTLTVIVIVFFIFNKKVRAKIANIFKDKIALSFLIIYFLFIIGMLWTEDYSKGFYILKRESLMLLSPLLILLLDKKYLKYVLPTVLSTVFISESIYLLEHFHIVDLYYKSKSIYHYPFIHRMYITTIIAFTIGYSIIQINFKKSYIYNTLYIVFILTSIYTLLSMGGRSGYINLFVILFILISYRFKKNILKGMLYSIIILITIFSIFYTSNQTFQNRINTTIDKIHNTDLSEKAKDMKNSNRTSIGCRIGFWYNSFDVIEKNTLLGVGTGDSAIAMERHLSTDEYKKLKTLCGLKVNKHFNSHNLYISMLLLFGLPGLIIIIYSFYLQIKVAILYSSQAMLILIIPTMITMLSQSSLFTSHYFIAFYAYMLTTLYLQEKQIRQEL